MTHKIRITKPAQDDMREIYNYIAKDLQNPKAAISRISAIDKAVQSLNSMPSRYPFVQDDYLASKGYRMITVKTHLIFFIVWDELEVVSVMRVLYARRDWLRILDSD